jgi:hypothetical protein
MTSSGDSTTNENMESKGTIASLPDSTDYEDEGNQQEESLSSIVNGEAAASTTEDDEATNKENFMRDEWNPPLVAATLITAFRCEPDGLVRVHETGLHHDALDPILAVQMYQEGPSDFRGQLESRISPSDDCVRVYVDEEGPPPEQEPSTSNDIFEETSQTSILRRNHCTILNIVFACCLVGATIVLALGLGLGLTAGSAVDIASFPLHPSIINQEINFLHNPTFCSRNLTLAWSKQYKQYSSQFNIASGAYYNESLHTLGVFVDQVGYDWTIHTFVLSETGMEVNISQELTNEMEVDSVAVSFNGLTLVMGVSKYFMSDKTENGGGAFLIFQRLDPDSFHWNLTHVDDIENSTFQEISDVAVNDDGSIVALLATRKSGESKTLVKTYRAVENYRWEPMGKSLWFSDYSFFRSVELSSNGTRLFMYKATLNIYDFSFHHGWTSSGNPSFSVEDKQIQVSGDGNIFVVGGDDSKEVFTLIDKEWVHFVSFSSGNNLFNFKSTLSNDGVHLFLSGVKGLEKVDNYYMQKIVGELYRRESNGFKCIASLTPAFPVQHVERIFFNEKANQVVIPTDQLLLAFEFT